MNLQFSPKILLAVSLLTSLSSCSITTDHYSEATEDISPIHQPLVNENRQVSPVLLELLNELHVEHTGNLEGIVAATQKKFLRPAGKERWEIVDIYKDAHPEKIRSIIEKIGLIHQHAPEQKEYAYALLLGATVQRMTDRLLYLLELSQKNIIPEKIIVLVGARPLDPNIENSSAIITALNKLPLKNAVVEKDLEIKTEAQAARLIFEKVALSGQLKKTTISIVETPMQQKNDGSIVRPTTADTINQWLKENPTPGKVLAISNQPFIGYQNAVLQTHLPKSFIIETVGERADEKTTLAVYLDNLARWLYQEEKRLATDNN
ncbi:hypothetical protein HYX58_00725 [Candidatus Dependentiae bacterium]|nr:hypothetical protein [Candidatus Dependentiae bacterium]